jgi:hypothetical protein
MDFRNKLEWFFPDRLVQPSLMFVAKGQEPILEWGTKNVLYLGRPLPYPQTLD